MYYTGYTTVVVVVVFAYGKIVSDSYIWPIDISIKVVNNKTEKNPDFSGYEREYDFQMELWWRFLFVGMTDFGRG